MLGACRLRKEVVLGVVGSLAVEGFRAEHDHVIAGAIMLPCLLLSILLLLLLLLLLLRVLLLHLHRILLLRLDKRVR